MRMLILFAVSTGIVLALSGCRTPPDPIPRTLARSDTKWRSVRRLPPHVQAAIAEQDREEMAPRTTRGGGGQERLDYAVPLPAIKRFYYVAEDGRYRVYWFHPMLRKSWYSCHFVEIDLEGRGSHGRLHSGP